MAPSINGSSIKTTVFYPLISPSRLDGQLSYLELLPHHDPDRVECPRPRYLIQPHPSLEALAEARRRWCQELIETESIEPGRILMNVHIPGHSASYQAEVVVFSDVECHIPYVVGGFVAETIDLRSLSVADVVTKARLLGAPFVACCSPTEKILLDADLWTVDSPESAVIPTITW